MRDLKAALLVTLALSATVTHAQLQVSTNLTPQQLVQDVLAGGCVNITNVSFNGQANPSTARPGSGSFLNGAATNLGLGAGIILSSGPVNEISGPANGFQSGTLSPNYTSDADLQSITGVGINNASILEFDFIPSGDSISFRYVFGSEEYPEFVCSQFNDAFGFFLSGPGISGPFSNNAVNLAIIPGGNVPVAINTVNSGSPGAGYQASGCAQADINWQSNSQYYVNNANGSTVVYDGFTVVLTAKAAVQCGQVYHIKLAIADASDSSYDSGVFIEAGSFTSVPFVPELAPSPAIVGNTILESCLELSMEFRRTVCDPSQPETIQLTYGGTATMGEDITPTFPDELTFGPGETSILVPFFAPVDPDGPETLIINIIALDCNGDLGTTTFNFLIDELPPMALPATNATIACGGSTVIAPVVTGGFGDYQYEWSTGDTTNTITVSPTADATYTLTVTDLCDYSITTSYPVVISPPPPLNISIMGSSDLLEGCETGRINIIRPQGAEGDITINLSTGGSATQGTDYQLPPSVLIPEDLFNIIVDIPTIADLLVEGNEPVEITGSYTNACAQTVTATVMLTIIDVVPLSVSVNDVRAECGPDSAFVQTVVSGGVEPFQYTWSSGEATAGVFVPLVDDAQLVVVVSDACGNEASATSTVIIDCLIIIPNVFTPNGDGMNDIWEIEGIGNRNNTVRVFNRWGQLVLDAKNYRNTWRATDVADGTYFYEVIVDGKPEPYTGHVTVLRSGW